jgi:hypothetical protein
VNVPLCRCESLFPAVGRPTELAVVASLRKRRTLAAEEFTFLRG